MPKSEKDCLSENDIDHILKEFNLAREFYLEIHELENNIEDGTLGVELIDLLAAGIFDINISLSAFKNPFYLDAQPVMFHAQQAVEKFLKSLYANNELSIIRSQGMAVDDFVKPYSHNLNKLSQTLEDLLADYNTVKSQVQALHSQVPNMNIRYKNSSKTIQDAIQCIDIMMKICVYVAKKLKPIN